MFEAVPSSLSLLSGFKMIEWVAGDQGSDVWEKSAEVCCQTTPGTAAVFWEVVPTVVFC